MKQIICSTELYGKIYTYTHKYLTSTWEDVRASGQIKYEAVGTDSDGSDVVLTWLFNAFDGDGEFIPEDEHNWDAVHSVRDALGFRQKKGWSQKKLSEKSGLQQGTLCAIERDNGVRSPTLLMLHKIADGLGVPIIHLLSDEPENVEVKSRLLIGKNVVEIIKEISGKNSNISEVIDLYMSLHPENESGDINAGKLIDIMINNLMSNPKDINICKASINYIINNGKCPSSYDEGYIAGYKMGCDDTWERHIINKTEKI